MSLPVGVLMDRAADVARRPSDLHLKRAACCDLRARHRLSARSRAGRGDARQHHARRSRRLRTGPGGEARDALGRRHLAAGRGVAGHRRDRQRGRATAADRGWWSRGRREQPLLRLPPADAVPGERIARRVTRHDAPARRSEHRHRARHGHERQRHRAALDRLHRQHRGDRRGPRHSRRVRVALTERLRDRARRA